MTTDICRLLGIDHPIILAPMGGAVGPDLAAAVSNAGGLGILPLWSQTPEKIREILRATRALSDKPIAANLNLEFDQSDRLDACLAEEVPIISFFWGPPPGALYKHAKEAGALVMHTVADAKAAKRAVDAGADVLVAQGWEAGGHVDGMVATLPLVPAVVDVAGDVPVIAAGGIGDGRGLAAVLALGAQAGWIGTRFLMSEEAAIHDDYRQFLIDSGEADTVHLMDLYDGGWPDAPHRAIRNSTVEAWEAAGSPAPGGRPNEGEIIATSPSKGDVRRYQSFTPVADASGQIEACSMWAGQSVAMARRVQPAAQILHEILEEARGAQAASAL